MNEFEEIVKASGIQPSTCSCKTCQSMCVRTPCIGTPDDMIRLVEAGHIDKLRMVIWTAGKRIGLPPIEMVQLDNEAEGCPLFVNGLCSVHAIKPTDGKLASCKPNKTGNLPAVGFVALTWTLPHNKDKIDALETMVMLYAATKSKEVVELFYKSAKAL